MVTLQNGQLKDDLAEIYKTVIPNLSFKQKVVTIYRPYYAPIREVLKFIKCGSSVYEIGCGTGPVLFLIHKYCKIKEGLGIDINRESIEIARQVNNHENLRFEVGSFYDIDVGSLRRYNVIVCFDVFHHIPEKERLFFLSYLIGILERNSYLIFKDLDKEPWYKYFANKITDVISTGSKVSYTSMEELVEYFKRNQLDILTAKRLDKWIWNHFLVVAQQK